MLLLYVFDLNDFKGIWAFSYNVSIHVTWFCTRWSMVCYLLINHYSLPFIGVNSKTWWNIQELIHHYSKFSIECWPLQVSRQSLKAYPTKQAVWPVDIGTYPVHGYMPHPRGRADVNECPLCISSVSLPQKWNCVGRIVTKKKVGPLMVIRTTQMLVQCVAVLERVYVWGFIIINPFFRVVHELYAVCVCCPKEIGTIWEESWKQEWDMLQCVTSLPVWCNAWTASFTKR